MQVESHEENQQLAAPAAATTVFCHFRVYYKLNILSIYIWIDYRLKVLSIESKNTHKGVLTKELCKLQAVKKIRNLQHLQQQQPLYFVILGCTISSILYQYIYICIDFILKGISIESKNTHNGVLTKDLCKLQAVKKISNLQHLQQQQPLSFVIFGCTISSILYQSIYG